MNAKDARFVLLATAAVMACGTLLEPIPGPADFTGVVEEVQVATGSAGSLLIARTDDGSAVVHVSDTTCLFRETGNHDLSPITLDAIALGTTVDVWTTGVELRSLPPQYYGRQVVARGADARP